MKAYTFTLILSGISELTPELSDALYEATRGDIELEMREGVAYLETNRSGPSLRDAILATIDDVENAGVGVRVIRVDSDVANTIAKINAELLGPAGRR